MFLLRTMLSFDREGDLVNIKDDSGHVAFAYATETMVRWQLGLRSPPFEAAFLRIPPHHPTPNRLWLWIHNAEWRRKVKNMVEDAALAALFRSCPGRLSRIIQREAEQQDLPTYVYNADLFPQVTP